MKRLRSVILLCAALAVVGCRVRPEQRAVLTQYEHDLRRYEDLIYDLEYEYEILCSENERLKDRLAAHEGENANRASPRLFRPRTSSPPSNMPKSKSKQEVLPDDDLAPPEIEAGPMTPMIPKASNTPSVPVAPSLPPEVPRAQPKENTLPPEKPSVKPLVKPVLPKFNTGSESEPLLEEPVIEKPVIGKPIEQPRVEKPTVVDEPPTLTLPSKSSQQNPPAKTTLPLTVPETIETLPAPKKDKPTSSPRVPELLPEPSDKSVSQIRLDAQQTQSIDLDRHAGDDALRVVLVPMNAEGQIVPVAGKISIVLLDPSKQGDEARVGRWDFAADFVRYQNHLAKRQHLTLDLPWSDGLPPSSELSLFVRYEAADGRLVESNDMVTLKLPGEATPQVAWTPRASHRRHSIAKAKTEPSEMKTESPILPAAHLEEAKAPATKTPVTKPEWKPYR